MGYKALVTSKELLGNIHPETFVSLKNLITYFVDNPRKDKFIEMKGKALALVNEFLQAIPTKDQEHEKLLRTKEWIEDSFNKKGLHTVKKKNRHKKRK
jgi:hypothetical protein